jgi:hypothetical protein
LSITASTPHQIRKRALAVSERGNHDGRSRVLANHLGNGANGVRPPRISDLAARRTIKMAPLGG